MQPAFGPGTRGSGRPGERRVPPGNSALGSRAPPKAVAARKHGAACFPAHRRARRRLLLHRTPSLPNPAAAGACAPVHQRGAGVLQGAVKVGNWGETVPTLGLGKRKCISGRGGARGARLRPGWPPRAGGGAPGPAGRRRPGGAGRGGAPGAPQPPLRGPDCLLPTRPAAGAPGPEGTAGRAACSHLGLLRTPRLLLSFTGCPRLPLLLFGARLDDIIPSSAYWEAGQEFKLLGFFFFFTLVEGGGRIPAAT